MPDSLIIEQGSTMVLGDGSGPPDLQPTRFRVAKIGDLAESGLIDAAELGTLMTTAQTVTSEALRSVETFRTRRMVPGTRRADLGRFPAMMAGSANVRAETLNVFWRNVRGIAPSEFVGSTLATEIARPFEVWKWLFGPITVGANSTLQIKAKHGHVTCGELVINAGGQIFATGSTLNINATSIKGV
jgi:hypothetical protein